ncbi:pitrilysin family protein [Pseudovibrio sp. SPO723]|uniref:M16 family metallopeptidase n=1 Tax=Nesiotobacter zosterae TaxID=392721 RepID=UPI0029C576B6|nr:pitrilysin family protein [Pseudovibrio sp. SPO723]MDX5592965.1 pitrilysin family protein [Pseudovibrio sp. SPO723]
MYHNIKNVWKSLRAGAVGTIVGLGFLAGVTATPAAAIEIQEVESPGGIKAWLVEDYTVPIIAMDFAFEGGTSQDPGDKLGLTSLLTTMLDEGAGEMDSQAFQQKLEDLTMELSFSAGRDYFYGSYKTLAANKDETSALVHAALTSPRFDQQPLERMKAKALAGIERSLKRPDSVAGLAFSKALFPDHPYGWPSSGTLETVTTLTADDLADQHKKIFARDGLTVGVVGAISAEDLAPLLDKVFGGLPETGNLTTIEDVEPQTGVVEHIAFDTPQTSIMFALPGLKRSDPDFVNAFIANHIMGGGTFSSWLYEEIREKRGLAYGVGSYLVPRQHTALWMGSTGTAGDKAPLAVDLIKQQLVRLAEEGPTEDELTKAKAFLTGSYALRFDSSSAIANQLVGIQTEELGIDYINTRNDLINEVTLDDVKAVSKKLLSGVEPAIVTVGPFGDEANAAGQ